MMKYLTAICAFLTLPFLLKSQHLDIGITGGAAIYQGELAMDAASMLKNTRYSGGLWLRYNINDFFATRLMGTYAQINGDDANASSTIAQARNLNFQSNIIEGALLLEINLFGYQPDGLTRPFSPYIFGGIGIFNFNPQTEYQGTTVDLQPLGTEGQGLADYPTRLPYQLTDIAVPFGFGVKLAVNDRINLGLEWNARLLFTDYLDDVSLDYVDPVLLETTNGKVAADLSNRSGVAIEPGTPRGGSVGRDWYNTFGISISFNLLDTGLSGTRRRSGNSGPGCFKF